MLLPDSISPMRTSRSRVPFELHGQVSSRVIEACTETSCLPTVGLFELSRSRNSRSLNGLPFHSWKMSLALIPFSGRWGDGGDIQLIRLRFRLGETPEKKTTIIAIYIGPNSTFIRRNRLSPSAVLAFNLVGRPPWSLLPPVPLRRSPIFLSNRSPSWFGTFASWHMAQHLASHQVLSIVFCSWYLSRQPPHRL
jgi:hypothetical protein